MSIYWDSMDFDSEGTLSTRNSSRNSTRRYIDPWDLENYAYMKQRYDYNTNSTPSVAGEPLQASSFYYTAYDDAYQMAPSNHWRYPLKDSSLDTCDLTPDYSDEDDENQLLTDGSLLYMYETTTRCRQMAVPKSSKSAYYHGYPRNGVDNIYSARKFSIYNNPLTLEDIYSKQLSQPLYADVPTMQKPENFGLSNYGHLKIDYSCSWNTLDRIIAK